MYDEDTHSEWIHESELPDLDFVKQQLSQLTSSIYKTGNVLELEDSLEEILATFNMKIPETKPLLKPAVRRTVFENQLLKAQ